MTKEALQKRIKGKFGTISKFARLSGEDRYELQKLFSRQLDDASEVARVSKLVVNTEVRVEANDLTAKHIKAFRAALDKAGGVRKFIADNSKNGKPVFVESTIHNILSGYRKHITPKIMVMFSALGVKI